MPSAHNRLPRRFADMDKGTSQAFLRVRVPGVHRLVLGTAYSSLLLMLALVLAGVPEAQATTFSYSFVGVVTEQTGNIQPGLGIPLNGSLIYEDGLSGTASPNAGEFFYNSSGTVSLSVDGVFPSVDLGRMILNDNTPMLGDRFALADNDPFNDSSITFIDSSGTALSSTAIPTLLTFGSWDQITFRIDYQGSGFFAGNITSLQPIVPEPSTALLVGLGLASLGACRGSKEHSL